MFLNEAIDFINCVKNGDIDQVANALKKYKCLFSGAVGVQRACRLYCIQR